MSEIELPFDVDLERFILHLIVTETDIEKATKKVKFLDDTHFQVPNHKDIFHLCELATMQGVLPDIVTLSSYNKKNHEEIADAIRTSVDINDSTQNFKEKVIALRNLAMRRESIKEIDKGMRTLSLDLETKSSFIVNNMSDSLSKIRKKYSCVQTISTKDTIRNLVQMYKEGASSNSKFRVFYGLDFIDRHICHLRGQLHALSARSGTGKTSFATSCIYHQLKMGYKIAYFCGESSKEEIMGRIHAHMAGISFEQMITDSKSLTKVEVDRLNLAIKELLKYEANLTIYGNNDYTHQLSDIEELVELLMEQHGGLDMVYFDYLQLMKAPKGLETKKTDAVETNINGLQSLTASNNFAGVIMSQLTSSAGKESAGTLTGKTSDIGMGAKLRMEDMRGGSAINNACHFVTFLQRSAYDQELFDKGKCPNNTVLTFWYSDKCRLQKAIHAYLGFCGTTGEYVPIDAQAYITWRNNYRKYSSEDSKQCREGK